ncbi:MAG: hypothetical protein IJF78_15460 [Clostridia bacterium]|nr:hypothetical protein [Clostridia bacterium]
MNYIPTTASETGSYLCTWDRQGFVASKYKFTGGANMRDALTPEYLFGEEENYHWLPREYRSGLYFLLDDGWDTPPHTENNSHIRPFGAVDPHPDKFGSLGRTPTERLTALNKLAQEWGYIGLGLWISPQMYMEDRKVGAEEAREYWIERAVRCQEAGVRYWKVDWGMHDHEVDYRRMLTEVVREYAPDLAVEHTYVQQPLSDLIQRENRVRESRELLAFSDFFRTYDIMWPFTDITTLSRIHELLSDPLPFELGAKGILSTEEQQFIAAGLGCAIGIMNPAVETRAVLRWQRIAPPFGAAESDYRCSGEMLTDSYDYPKNPVRWVHTGGRVISETAPAVMARGCALPAVEPIGQEKPYVLASRNPHTGAYAIASIRRNIAPNPMTIVPADVTWELEDMDAFVGVFGYFESLTLVYPEVLPADCRIFAQNLMDDEAQDITDQVQTDGSRLTLPARTLMQIGACNFAYPNMGGRKMTDPMLLIRLETNT